MLISANEDAIKRATNAPNPSVRKAVATELLSVSEMNH